MKGVNWSGHEGLFEIYQDNRLIATLNPQKRIYEVSQTPTTEAAIYQINTGHIFLTIPEVMADGSAVRVRALHNPLVLWVWYGGGIMGLGIILNIFRGGRKKESVPEAVSVIEIPSSEAPQEA